MNYVMDKILEWIISTVVGVIYDQYLKICNCVLTMTLSSTMGDTLTTLPSQWNGGTIYALIKNVSNEYILPIGAIFITFFMFFDLIHNIIGNNKLSDINTGLFITWVFKLGIILLLVSHSFEIIECIFIFVTNIVNLVRNELLSGTLGIDGTTILNNLNSGDTKNNFIDGIIALSPSEILNAVLVAFICGLFASLLSVIFIPLCTLVLIFRFVYIYIYMSFAPIAFASFGNNQWSDMGKNYLRHILALAFQIFIIVLIIAIYYGCLQSMFVFWTVGDNATLNLDQMIESFGILILMSFATIYFLFKSDNMSRTIFSAH